MSDFLFAYGKMERLTPDQFEALCGLDNFDSGEAENTDYAVQDAAGQWHEGILDDFDNVDMDLFAEIMEGTASDVPVTTTTKDDAGRAGVTTPNDKAYRGEIVSIPGGQFAMGSINGWPDEKTVLGSTVTVTMTGFKLSKSEVTVGQYKAYLAATGDPQYSKLPAFDENKKGDNFPVVGLTYNEKTTFCKYFGGTLPTAAQIEYASKGPRHTDCYGTPYGRAAIYNNGFRTTAEVCGTNNERANDYGVCDLAGNVWETTLDQYDSEFYNRMSTTNPSNPLTNSSRQCVEARGGSWFFIDWVNRSANRGCDKADGRDVFVGFRCAWPQDS